MTFDGSKHETLRVILCWWIAGIAFSVSSISLAFLLCGPEQKREFVLEAPEPEQWVSREFPVLDDISQPSLLARGSWLILLADRRCPDCLFLTADFVRLAEELSERKSPETPQFCILEYGPHLRGEKLVEQIQENSVVCCVSASPSSPIAPGSRGIVHLRDSQVAQVFAPTELGLVLKVFGS